MFHRIINYVALIKGVYVKLKCRILFGEKVKIGKGFLIHGPIPYIKVSYGAGGRIHIGDNVVLVNSTRYNYVGVVKSCSIVAEGGIITIGKNSGMSGVSIFSCNAVSIGANATFGANCFIMDTDFHSIEPETRLKEYGSNVKVEKSMAVTIGDNVFLGLGVIILKGVVIGQGGVVGAGTVVSNVVEQNSVCIGPKNRFLNIKY